ncbi:YdcF family protein [Afifella sp. H1R]|uniref:YdcF family protein n=1 Tax=Afifella sp. H1R TaxID=2908841 RepID=UPI001F3CB968|nr:YdcF family protein [Afifella sp. H1R]MCF1505428.1 YdcF family protein [Afifella sp. H1R]
MSRETLAEKVEAKSSRPRPSIGRRLVRVVVFAVFLIGLFFVGGFLIFAQQVASARPPAAPQADAIVALTGGSARVEGGVELLRAGAGQRLLISGVYADNSKQSIANAVASESSDLFRCCVDLGKAARDTRGNAEETREWVRHHGYHSLIVVTSAYHMPRSIAELRREIPDVRLIPYPVRRPGLDLGDWAQRKEIFVILFREYLKYIVVKLR